MIHNFLTPKVEAEAARAVNELERIAGFLERIALALEDIAAAPNYLPTDMGVDLEHTPGDPGIAEVFGANDPDPDEEREGVEPKPDPAIVNPAEEQVW